MLEKTIFLQLRPCRGYIYVRIPQDIGSSSLHMCYYMIVLNSLAKFTEMRRERSLFSTCEEDFIFSLLFITRESEVITSFYQVTAMEQIDTLIFDAVIKLRNNKKQPNENSIHT